MYLEIPIKIIREKCRVKFSLGEHNLDDSSCFDTVSGRSLTKKKYEMNANDNKEQYLSTSRVKCIMP